MAAQYRPDMRDIRFALFDQHGLAARAEAAGFDRDTLEGVLDEAARVATDVLGPLNAPGDRIGCKLDGQGNVTTPPGFKAAWQTLVDGGWIGMNGPAELGGMGLPDALHVATNEMFSGAAVAFMMYPGLTAAAARMIAAFGPSDRRDDFAGKLFRGEWAGTMCLTEAGAGSDVGANRCRANRTEVDGEYLLEGEKIFISSGDHDLTPNILHLVLARTPDAPAGTRGLSLFIVPKFLPEADGSLGARNGAFVVGIEEKMGIHGSSTCTLALGANGPCRAWRVGEEGQGMPIMFHMMNEARLGVGVQGLAVAAAAYGAALGYCNERVQGSHVTRFKDADAPRVAISEHPDVRRMLMLQKTQVEAMRSFLYRIAALADAAKLTTDEAEKRKLEGRIDLLVPIAKAHCTDVGFDSAVTSLQCFGGYGYICEYPAEQYVRDAKIFSIYEGTNGIQAMDLIGRKMTVGQGALFLDWMQDAMALCETATATGLAKPAEAIGKAIQSLGGVAMHLAGLGQKKALSATMLQATSFLKMFGTVQLALECLDQAAVATRLGTTDAFLRNKVRNLDFYVANLLPGAIALGRSIQADDRSALEVELYD